MEAQPRPAFEIWGGVECTVNRVEGRYSNQIELNGHFERADDLNLFADLGIKKIRYPILWELVAPNGLESPDWTWSDDRMQMLRDLRLTPIVGLLHHGSGPTYTSLLDPEFPEKLASYASLVARRYPWIEWYTPVNEPLTTARFSGLYGAWYPHHRSDTSFVRLFLNEIKGTVLAMKAIRAVNPNAKLVQTEDMGRASGTPALAYQIAFENERRWLTFDLLFGKVDEHHPLFTYLTTTGGATTEEVNWFRENPLPPDVIGINHYPLSNRFLDHRLDLYPQAFHGGNGTHDYADVGAVDSGQATPPMPYDVLKDVWDRYASPIAVTEAHIAGGRETQLRWFTEVCHAANRLRGEGADVRAVTAWSLLGSFDWNSLCTQCANFYESGVFDVRAETPRPTALSSLVRSIASEETMEHPLLERPGYWREPSRVLFAPPDHPLRSPSAERTRPSRPILITGARGTLGRAFARVCELRGIDYKLVNRQQMDIASRESVREALSSLKPWAVINTAGYVRVDDAEDERDRCWRENALGPAVLAEECATHDIPMLTFSTDFVFDGSSTEPYRETHQVSPLNVYGHTKAEAEQKVLSAHERALIVRTSSFFGPWDEYNFAHVTLRSLRSGELVRVADDIQMSPTYVPDLVTNCLDLLIDGEFGILHLANQGSISWAEWARRMADFAKISRDHVHGVNMIDLRLRATRPRQSALASDRARVMPAFEDALDRYVNQLNLN